MVFQGDPLTLGRLYMLYIIVFRWIDLEKEGK